MKNSDNETSIEMQAKMLALKDREIDRQVRLIDDLTVLLKNLSAEAGRCHGEEESLLYAVYEVSPARGSTTYLAVCLDNPFLYTVAESREKATGLIREKVAVFYGTDDLTDNPHGGPCGTLEGIEIPNALPEEF